MSRAVTKQFVREHVGAIASPLYEGVTTGLADADARLAGLPRLDENPALTSLVARHAMRNYWLSDGIADTWEVQGQPRLMGQTILVNAEAGLELRLLKERMRTYPGGVPQAGKNELRRGWWSNHDLPVEGLVVPGAGDLEVERTRLLLLFDRLTAGEQAKVSVRVVHTLSEGVYGRAVPIDMSFNIDPSGEMFDQLRFEGDPQNDDFFPDIAEDDNEGGHLGQ